MRLSVLRDDPGFHPMAHSCKVFLEGSERRHVLTADEERRMAVLHKLDEAGHLVVKDGEIETETFYGSVRIETSDEFSAAAWMRASGGTFAGL